MNGQEALVGPVDPMQFLKPHGTSLAGHCFADALSGSSKVAALPGRRAPGTGRAPGRLV